MLQHLHIQNFAIISTLDIDFANGFSVITGETGAGKSIILGALSLLMGERADSKLISEGEQKCVIEAQFELPGSGDEDLQQLFETAQLDYDNACIIRRELTANGKSRAFVNDTPVQLSTLKQISGRLVDIHSQHQNLLLRDDDFQLSIIDTLAHNKEARDSYSALYAQHCCLLSQLRDAQSKRAKAQEDADYINFQLTQLRQAQLKSGELEQLEAELMQLTHAEDISLALGAAVDMIENGNMLEQINDLLTRLRQAKDYHSECLSLYQRLQEVEIELKDMGNDATKAIEHIEYNPERLAEVSSRIDTVNTLLHKHHASSVDELIQLRDSLEKSENDNTELEILIDQLTKQLASIDEQLAKVARQLSLSRKQTAPSVAERLVALLARLGMQNAKVDVQFKPTQQPTPSGTDIVTFLFSANKNQTLRPIAQVASGGEMARLMLSLKSLIADRQTTETIIFDEIDTGVSGEVASNMGRMMQQMATHRQIIAITHLPQIAALGSAHYKVYKEDNANRTETQISQLNKEQRILELAALLSGENITSEAIRNAEVLIKDVK
ncbi:MAG: DNA repair protein RecN [Paludibacteraceae bacterium]|nr:DNA repair protein RecN [Paludibacteraceae bacterium]